MMKVYTYRQSLERQRGKKLQVEQDISDLKEKLVDIKRDLRRHEQAHIIIRTVGLETQQQLQFHISDITSLALEAVFPDPYELKVEFVERRNKTECDLRFVRDGEELNPMTSSGVGAVDVASFALRIASWSMERPRTRNVIILDEPFKFLSENYQDQASSMLKELSSRLGLQFIIVTHEPILASYADRTFEVRVRKGKSKVKQL
jgi:predicted ABC-type transport system involved in lysophospholipase L1 biosynthesis ATPase subunit